MYQLSKQMMQIYRHITLQAKNILVENCKFMKDFKYLDTEKDYLLDHCSTEHIKST